MQHWVINTLDNSINLDPAVLAQVAELDDKAGCGKKENNSLSDVDISGFHVLLNACKPAILEARPPMKLNVVKEVTRGLGVGGLVTIPDKKKKKNQSTISLNRKSNGKYYGAVKKKPTNEKDRFGWTNA